MAKCNAHSFYRLLPPLRLGNIVVSDEAQGALLPYDLVLAVFRHAFHDWGDIPLRTRKANGLAIVEGGNVYSSYRSRLGVDFHIATEADRSETAVFLFTEV